MNDTITCPHGIRHPWVCHECDEAAWNRRAARSAPEAGKAVDETLQARVQPWMMACFGREISGDRVERGDRIEAERDAAEFAARNGKSLAEDSIHAIRELLREAGVPLAAFIDDHVGNAVVQRNQAEARATASEAEASDLRRKLEEAEAARPANDAILQATIRRAEAAERKLKEARKALEPFAAQAGRYDPPEDDDNVGIWGGASITLGMLRAARRALTTDGGA